MLRLALRVDARLPILKPSRAVLPLEAGAAVQLDRQGGGRVLLYQQEPGGPVHYLGLAQASKSRSDAARPDDSYVDLSDIIWFESAVPSSEEIVPASWHPVSPEQVAASPPIQELAEEAARFEPLTPPEAGPDLIRAVLENCGYTCAWSGRVFAAAPAPHPDLSVAVLMPESGQDATHVSSYLAMQHDAAAAFRELQFTAAGDHAVIADLSRLPAALLAEQHASGRLVVPAYPAVPPDPMRMAEHRLAFFRRQRG